MRNVPKISAAAIGNSPSTAVRIDTAKSPRLAVSTSNQASHQQNSRGECEKSQQVVPDEAEHRGRDHEASSKISNPTQVSRQCWAL